jgi:hypothetical protein
LLFLELGLSVRYKHILSFGWLELTHINIFGSVMVLREEVKVEIFNDVLSLV